MDTKQIKSELKKYYEVDMKNLRYKLYSTHPNRRSELQIEIDTLQRKINEL